MSDEFPRITERRFEGKLVHQNETFGLIARPRPLKDVLAPADAIASCSPGDTLRFSVCLSPQGTPQARTATAADPTPPKRAADIPGITGRRFTGTLEKILHDQYFNTVNKGFVSAPELHVMGLEQVVAHKIVIADHEVGDVVTFTVDLKSSGKVFVHNAAFIDGSSPEAQHEAAEVMDLGRFNGSVVQDSHGFSFVESNELHAIFGRDAFIVPRDLDPLCIGNMVSFDAMLHPGGLL
mmetsp:Transcript_87244/g.224695  ORF Transcript_87244/g.224695 Transcript_87244/m.224695 type:complete len:237 (-) Transcript_87244:212-922(-)